MDYPGTGLTVITGASSGIGARLAVELAARGAHLLLTGRNEARLRQAAQDLPLARGASVETVVADLAAAPGVAAVTGAIRGRPVDVLVNNAGFATYGPHAGIDPAAEEALIAVNCAALVALTRAVLPGMLGRQRGTVMNVASTIAFQPSPLQAVYGASKAFVLSYSQALHEEVRGSGVSVIAFCPGPTHTGFFSAMNAPTAASSQIYRRGASVEHVARAAIRALDRRPAVAIVGAANAVFATGGRFMPRALLRRMTGWMLRPPQPPVSVANETVIAAGAQQVWTQLATVSQWPQWYKECRWTSTTAQGPVSTGDVFTWRAYPVTLHSTVVEAEAGRSLRFDAKARGLHAEVSLVLDVVDGGTRVRCVETQTGPLPSLGRSFLRRTLLRAHEGWLDNLRDRVAEGGAVNAAS